MNFIKEEMHKTQAIILRMLDDLQLQNEVQKIAERCIQALQLGNKILFAGNGGSAADSQHLAAELVSRLRYNRPGLAAIALTTDTSALTAIGNDYSFQDLFARQIEAIGRPGDVLIAISTSGKSPNILKALETARARKMSTIGFTGKFSSFFSERCDLILNIPSMETPKIQECHIMMGHIICALIEEEIFGSQYNPDKITAVSGIEI